MDHLPMKEICDFHVQQIPHCSAASGESTSGRKRCADNWRRILEDPTVVDKIRHSLALPSKPSPIASARQESRRLYEDSIS
jgi:hypothetical protein